MKEYFLKLYKYSEWANARVIACLKKQSINDVKALSLLGHVLAAQFLWLHRIKGLPPPPYKLWEDRPLTELERMADEIGKQWNEYVLDTENFNWDLSYKNYYGDPYVSNVEAIMIHTVNHGSYHRAQIAMLLRQKGFEPVNTDFITYDRVLRGQLKD